MTFRFRKEVVSHIEQTHKIKFCKTVWKRGILFSCVVTYLSNWTFAIYSKLEPLPGSSNDNEEEEDSDDDDDDEDEQEIQALQTQHQQIENGNRSHEEANSYFIGHFSNQLTDDNFYSRKRWINSVPSNEKHLYKYQCTWPGCGKTSGIIWNMRRHIRTVHFKLPKTKQEMQNENINVFETDRQESQFINIFPL